jgi:hypothetical protein
MMSDGFYTFKRLEYQIYLSFSQKNPPAKYRSIFLLWEVLQQELLFVSVSVSDGIEIGKQSLFLFLFHFIV